MLFGLGDDDSSTPDYSPAGLWAQIQAIPGFSDYDDSVDQTCYASWLAAPPAASTSSISSGCGTTAGPNGSTYLPCPPTTLAAAARLDVDTYSLARHLQSEVGSSSVANMAAVGLDAKNQANERGISLTQLLTTPGMPSGAAWSGMYGQINSPGGGNSGQGRWGATSADPTALSIAMAQLVTSGAIDGWNNGGDDQDGLNVGSAFASVAAKINAQAAQGSYWVGLIPGLDHWETVTWKNYKDWFGNPIAASSPLGQYLIQRAMVGFSDPSRASVQWDPSLPFCAPPSVNVVGALETAATSIAGFALGYYGMKFLIKRRRG